MARFYDKIYHWKDYPKEVRQIKGLIRRYKRSPGKALLDVACGTGRHLQYLQEDFDCTGTDISRKMLEVARKNVPKVEFIEASMEDFELSREFDVVLCLFSSIGHLRTKRALNRALANFARHTKKGGVLIIEPWIRESAWRDKSVGLQTYDSDSLKIARVIFGRAKGRFTTLDEKYLIAEKGKGIVYIEDRHKMRFFEPDATLATLEGVGFKPRLTKYSLMPGRGLIIATRK